jgi:hypothetical protein
MYPYNVYEVTMPNSHRTSSTTKIVHSIVMSPQSYLTWGEYSSNL